MTLQIFLFTKDHPWCTCESCYESDWFLPQDVPMFRILNWNKGVDGLEKLDWLFPELDGYQRQLLSPCPHHLTLCYSLWLFTSQARFLNALPVLICPTSHPVPMLFSLKQNKNACPLHIPPNSTMLAPASFLLSNYCSFSGLLSL